MDYKRIFRTRASREFILRLLRFIPDKTMLKIQYRIKMGRRLNIKNPKRYTEKLQWYKLNYRDPLFHQCVDKYAVRDYINKKGLGDILVELYAKYDSINEIQWDRLPDCFVIKTINGGGGNNIVICTDKRQINEEEIKTKLICKKIKTHTGGREWSYYNLDPGIIVEKLLVNNDDPKAGVNDYKILCFGGKAEYVIVDVDRYIGHKRNFYDVNWNRINVTSDCPASDRVIEKPKNYEKMIETAEILSKDFPIVRVDLYNMEGKIYFGELTFYPWSGYVQFDPDDFDFVLGEKCVLPKEKK